MGAFGPPSFPFSVTWITPPGPPEGYLNNAEQGMTETKETTMTGRNPAQEGIDAARRDAADLHARQQNAYGFYGTLKDSCEERLDDERLDTLFMEAARQLATITNCTHYEATEWLDSSLGRHLAHEVAHQVDADVELELGGIAWLRQTRPAALAKRTR